MTKKVKYLLLFSFIMLLGLCTKSQARITTTDPTVESGGTVTITINSQEKVASGAIDVTSNDGLTFVSASGGEANGTYLAFAGSENKTSGIATYTFKAPKVTKTSTYKVVFTSQYMADADGKEIASSSGTATVTVTAKGGDTSSDKNENDSSNESKPSIPEASFESVEQTVYATSDVNVRSNYSTDSSIVGSLGKNESIKRTGIGDNGWSKVTYNGYTAYINSDFLTTTKPTVTTTKDNEEDDEKEEKEDTEKSKNNKLKVLEVAPEGLEPRFDPNTTSYTLEVGSNIDSLTINAEADDEKAKVKISGNENFEIGENEVIITVTAEDGTENEYTINVVQEETAQLGLKELLVEGLPLNPKFSEEIYEYTLTLDRSDVSEVNITAISTREDASVEILGNSDLKPGDNVITILVTDGEGEEQETITYQITVTIPQGASEGELILGLPKDEFYKDLAILAIIMIVLIILFVVIAKFRKKKKEEDELYNNNFDDYNTDSDITDTDKEIGKLSEEELPRSLRKEKETSDENIKAKNEYDSISKDDERKNKLDKFTSAVDEDAIRRKGKHF